VRVDVTERCVWDCLFSVRFSASMKNSGCLNAKEDARALSTFRKSEYVHRRVNIPGHESSGVYRKHYEINRLPVWHGVCLNIFS
jgi:hypothetical protein